MQLRTRLNFSLELHNNQNCFLIGVGGSGMAPLAHMLLDKGLKVFGQDKKLSESIRKLEEKGLTLSDSLSDLKIDFAIYSSAIKKSENQFYQFFLNNHIPLYHRSEILHAFYQNKKSISVAGSHGKTSTTTMIAQILLEYGLDPTIMIGGETPLLNGIGGRYGNGEWGVYESDESDGTFLNHDAEIKVLTNIDNDHLDFYRDTTSLEDAFRTYLFSNVVQNSIACLDDLGIQKISRDINLKTYNLFYCMNDYYNLSIQNYKISDSNLYFNTENKEFELKLPIAGSHFLQNAMAAILACSCVGISPEFSVQVLSRFCGVKRRMELKGFYKNCRIYDDYGHHPTEIRVVLQALTNLKSSTNKTKVLFQPHRYTRTRDLFKELGESLSYADTIYLLPIYSAGESQIPGITSEILVPAIKTRVILLQNDLEKDTETILEELNEGDLILSLGAGNVHEWVEYLLKK